MPRGKEIFPAITIALKVLINAIEAKLDARLDAAVSSRAIPGDAMALTPAERLVVQALIINDLTPFAGADIAAILADTVTINWADITTIDGLIDDIIADIGVFPTANYATFAAYVEDIRTRLTAILTETESHPTLAEIQAGDMATILTETQSHPTLAEIEAGDMASILTDTADIQPRIPRIVCSMDFWSDKDDEFLLNTTADDKPLPDVVVSGLPANVTIIRVVAMFMCRAIEDTSAGANAINGLQYIQMRKAAGSWTNAIKLVDNLWAVADSIREMGDAFPGNIDLHTTVDGDATYNFQTHNVVVDGISLKFNDLQVGLRVYFTV